MNTKAARHRQILRLVRQGQIGTQTDLAQALAKEGHQVSQPTLSKDMTELGLSKVHGPDGVTLYQVPGQVAPGGQAHRLRMELTEFLISWEQAGKLVVLKTVNGHAAGVAWAVDGEAWQEVVGTVAGEDTVLVVARTESSAAEFIERLEEVLAE
ncbi:MAG: arginine repressor [Candidatus Latescibacteria bacterium]|nr:arginine repressor [Candidatus Latescibacterota bacterium]